MHDAVFYFVMLISAGVSAGFLAGLFGIGGGLVLVPVLFYLFPLIGVDAKDVMNLAVGTSLATILPTAISSLRKHHQLNNVDWTIVRRFSVFLIVGAVLGGTVVSSLPAHIVRAFFCALLVFMAFRMVWPFSKTKKQFDFTSGILGKVLPLLIGLASAIAGVGGGALGAPLLVLSGRPAHQAVGTASSFGLLISLPAIVTLLVVSNTPESAPLGSYGLICFPAFLVLAVCTVIVAPLGAKVGSLIPSNVLTKMLAILLAVVAVKMWFFS